MYSFTSYNNVLKVIEQVETCQDQPQAFWTQTTSFSVHC